MYANITTDLLLNSRQRKPAILAVDDNEDNLLLLLHVLRHTTHCKLLTARNGQQALFVAKNYLPNLILLEVTLPDRNGLEIIRELKQDEITSRIPVIAVTSLASRQERERILKAGCDEYISKPYLLEELETIVSRYIRSINV